MDGDCHHHLPTARPRGDRCPAVAIKSYQLAGHAVAEATRVATDRDNILAAGEARPSPPSFPRLGVEPRPSFRQHSFPMGLLLPAAQTKRGRSAARAGYPPGDVKVSSGRKRPRRTRQQRVESGSLVFLVVLPCSAMGNIAEPGDATDGLPPANLPSSHQLKAVLGGGPSEVLHSSIYAAGCGRTLHFLPRLGHDFPTHTARGSRSVC